MKRLKYSVMAISIAAVMALTACTGAGNNDNNDDNNTNPPAQEEIPNEPSIPNEPNVPEEPEMPDNETPVPDNETSQTMSTDFEEIGTHNNEKKGWGPGGPVDENNRSQGAIMYQQKYGDYNADFIAPMGNKIYLTFDEGYENGYTSQILDVLKDKNVSAVFFVTYPYAKQNPELIKRMIDEGHIVGNHSTKHLSFPSMNIKDAKEDILNLHNYIKDNYNYEMKLFRFPMGEFSEQTLELLNQMNYRSVFWSFAYKDWITDNQPEEDYAINHLNEKAHGGAIYLLHAVSKTNADILGRFIDNMRDKNYEFSKYDL